MIATALLALAVAAPVPKEAADQKLVSVYGTPTEPEYPVAEGLTVRSERTKNGVLHLTVPKSHPSRDLDACDGVRPQLVREVDGDFQLTVRVQHQLAKSADRARDAAGRRVVGVWAGVGIWDGETREPLTTFVHGASYTDSTWTGLYRFHLGVPNERGASGSTADLKRVDQPLWLRLQRSGNKLEYQVGRDGKNWTAFYDTVCKADLPRKLKVGPVAFKTTAEEYTAEFDQYEIQPLKSEKK